MNVYGHNNSLIGNVADYMQLGTDVGAVSVRGPIKVADAAVAAADALTPSWRVAALIRATTSRIIPCVTKSL